MTPEKTTALQRLTSKLERLGTLDSEDRERLAALSLRLERVPRWHRLVREGDEPEQCCLLVDGYASRYKHSVYGSRQVVSFHIRGDLLDIQHLLLSRADHNVQTITPAHVAWIPRSELLSLAWERSAVGKTLWRDCLIDASIFREWVLNVGQRDAKSRIAHMLCEFAARCHAAGLGPPEALDIPMTQEQIADATGLSAVHVNRMLQALRADGAITRNMSKVRIFDWDTIRAIAAFDPAYLHEAA
jgi:CRP-like cAMP-binding protein